MIRAKAAGRQGSAGLRSACCHWLPAAGYASLLVLPLLLLWRPLFGAEALFWGTPLLQFVPWQRLAAQMWRSGHLPLWNPFLGCGTPLAANYQTGAFYPLYGLSLILPAEVALGWTVSLHLLLAGLAMVAWGRAAGLDRPAALLAGLTLQGSGFLVARAGLFPSMVVAFTWLPIWLWRGERLVQTGRACEALLLGGALGIGLLAGHAQTAFYGLLLLAAYLAFRTIWQPGNAPLCGNECRVRWRLIRLWSLTVASFVLGAGLAAIQLLPTAELLHFSPRAAGVEQQMGMTYSLWPWRLLTLVAPDLFGSPARGNYWGYGNYWEDALYIGVLPLLLALRTLTRVRRKGPWQRPAVFWGLAVGGSLLLALGRHTPVFPWLFEHVPTFDWFQAPGRWLAVTTVALSALAGMGAQEWIGAGPARRRGALAAVLGLAVALGGLVAPRMAPGIKATFGPATVRFGLTLAATGGLLVLRPGRNDRLPGRCWQGAMLLTVLLDLAAFGWGLVPSVDRALYGGHSATAESLRANGGFVRTFWPAGGSPEPGYDLKFNRYFRFDGYGPHQFAFWWSLRESMLPNLGMLDGVASANNFDPLLVEWYADFARTAERAPHLLPAMGITHLITATAAGEVWVTRLAGSLGRAWVVPAARALPEAQMLAELSRADFDPAGEVLVDQQVATERPLGNRIRYHVVLQDFPNRVTIHATLDQPGYLVLADIWYPGWRASVDGKSVALWRANYAFRAVRLETGEHQVEMAYRPWSVQVGAALSLAAWLGLAGGLLGTRRRRTG